MAYDRTNDLAERERERERAYHINEYSSDFGVNASAYIYDQTYVYLKAQ